MEQMTNEEYAFFLAYGVQDDTELHTQEMLDAVLDVEM
jgi:hypothetical protein